MLMKEKRYLVLVVILYARVRLGIAGVISLT
jgi:hypothetical protein